jgi:hypothetical protein
MEFLHEIPFNSRHSFQEKFFSAGFSLCPHDQDMILIRKSISSILASRCKENQ